MLRLFEARATSLFYSENSYRVNEQEKRKVNTRKLPKIEPQTVDFLPYLKLEIVDQLKIV